MLPGQASSQKRIETAVLRRATFVLLPMWIRERATTRSAYPLETH